MDGPHQRRGIYSGWVIGTRKGSLRDRWHCLQRWGQRLKMWWTWSCVRDWMLMDTAINCPPVFSTEQYLPLIIRISTRGRVTLFCLPNTVNRTITKHRHLKDKSAATALNTVRASVYSQTTYRKPHCTTQQERGNCEGTCQTVCLPDSQSNSCLWRFVCESHSHKPQEAYGL